MSPMPTQMINRWQDRKEPDPGHATLYWHILVGDHPEVREIIQAAQQRLADFSGLHMTPPEWLHITTLIAGHTDEITTEQQQDLLATASDLLTDIPPVTITLGHIFYHPEAIAATVRPNASLYEVHNAVRTATRKVTGRDGDTEGPAWTPHMTLAYSETQQPAEPLITALGRELPACEATINEVTLVAQQGPERLWDWHPVGHTPLGPHCPIPRR